MGTFAVRTVMIAMFLAMVLRGQDQDVSLVIRFAGGANHFKVGEVIPVELSYSASTPGKYSFNTASYDRGGRLGIEQFVVEPPGRDPLDSYYRDPMQAFMQGGLSSMLPLDAKPQLIKRDLNEWVAFDRPGRYTLRVISGRVGRVDGKPNRLTSNTLEFDIETADAAWQQQTVARAAAVLDDPARAQSERTAAQETLRYLDCPESVRELARQLTMAGHEDNKWNFEAGLLGARDQDLVFKELEDRFFAPDAALGQSYLWLVARMEFARVSGKLPAYPKNDLAKQKDWQEAQEKLFALLKARQDAVYERAADAVALKQGAAKASTVAAVLRSSLEQARKLPGEEIADMFPLLDRAQQELILGTLFDRVNVPAMAGPLAAILDQQDFPGGSLLRVYALEVLLQVNPQIGRERMLAEMRAPHADSLNNPGFMIRCLSRLPDAALPELNQLFLKRLEEADYPLLDLYAGLTGRYATDAVLPQVKKVYQDRVNS